MRNTTALQTTASKLLGLAAFAGCQSAKVGPTVSPALSFVLLDAKSQNLLTNTATAVSVTAVNSQGQAFALGSECQGGGCPMVRQAQGTGAAAPKYAYHYSTQDAPAA